VLLAIVNCWASTYEVAFYCDGLFCSPPLIYWKSSDSYYTDDYRNLHKANPRSANVS